MSPVFAFSLMLLAALALAAAVWLWRRPADAGWDPGPVFTAMATAVQRAWHALCRRLRLLRGDDDAARYAQPWVALIGEGGAGKSSLLASLAQARLLRDGPLPADASAEQAAVLADIPTDALKDAQVLALRDGVLIDVAGQACAGALDKAAAPRWRAVLAGLDGLRPERALDALALVVSARSLLSGDDALRRQIGHSARAQIESLGRRLGLRLPVYWVVSQCDAIAGFGAFCQTLPAPLAASRGGSTAMAPQPASMPQMPRAEMFGWSAPTSIDASSLPVWLSAAFDEMGQQIEALQVATAAQPAQIDQASDFLLFAPRFAALCAPLTEHLGRALREQAWADSMVCRGVYFTGALGRGAAAAVADPGDSGDSGDATAADPPRPGRSDIAFVNDLFAAKVLAERGLTRVTRPGRWSRDRLLRRVQWAGVGLTAVLGVGVALSAWDLRQRVKAQSAALSAMQAMQAAQSAPLAGARVAATTATTTAPTSVPATTSASTCATRVQVQSALTEIAALDQDLSTLWMPASLWLQQPNPLLARVVAEGALGMTVLPALRCQLSARVAQRSARMRAFHATAPSSNAKGHSAPAAAAAPAAAPSQASFAALRSEALALAQQTLLIEQQLDQLASATTPGAIQRMPALSALLKSLYDLTVSAAEQRPQSPLAQGLGVLNTSAAAWPAGLTREALSRQWADDLAQWPAQLQRSLQAELIGGPALLQPLGVAREGQVADLLAFGRWLNGVNSEWLPFSGTQDPCTQTAAELGAVFNALLQRQRYPAGLGAALQRLATPAQCLQPAQQALLKMPLAPYGTLLVGGPQAAALNPSLAGEVRGLTALAAQGFMQLNPAQPFACMATATQWRSEDIARATQYAVDYQRFAAAQGLPPQGRSAAAQPLFDRIARSALERAMNDAMRAAQSPTGWTSSSSPAYAVAQASGVGTSTATAPTTVATSTIAAPVTTAAPSTTATLLTSATAAPAAATIAPLAATDAALLTQSSDMARVLDGLLSVQRLYAQLGFTASAAKLTQCTAQFANQALQRVRGLANQSRLYAPDVATTPGLLLDLGGTALTRDYLLSQVARAQVLAAYAEPFVNLLRNGAVDGPNATASDASNSSGGSAPLPYWGNTLNQLSRYLQFNDSAGQIGQLNGLLQKTLADLTPDNCAARLAAYKPGDASNDLFYERRQALVTQVGLACTANAYASYQQLATRFNDKLKGLYPFGDLSAKDANLADVKAFFADYGAQGPALAASLAQSTDARASVALKFLAQLDKAAAFLRASLGAGEISAPISLTPSFRLLPTTSPGSDQVVSWALSAGARVIRYPGIAAPTLDWPFGEALTLDMVWASGSVWRPTLPVASTASSTATSSSNATAAAAKIDFTVDGPTVSFSGTGDWALLRLIEAHKPRYTAATDVLDARKLVLEFSVPTLRAAAAAPTAANGAAPKASTAEARLYLGLSLSVIDPKTQAPSALIWPGSFVRSAPLP